jgi:N-sulfoglucosamine sulfohydrolase
MKRRDFLNSIAIGALATKLAIAETEQDKALPNILIAIADDWSWPHASMAYKLGIRGSDSVIQTPTFDRIAREGVLFKNAFCCAPSCGPSRSAILTGRYIWQLETAANLRGVLPLDYEVYPDILEKAGYHVGFMSKGWSPGAEGNRPLGDRKRNPAGPMYKSFVEFMANRPQDMPICFWCGGWDAHRPYVWESGLKNGLKPEDVAVPGCLPDNLLVRKDICDYYYEVQRFDRDVGAMLKLLEDMGELDNTIIVMTGDNGLPFPRCKVELYDLGTHVPLAICWGNNIKAGRIVDDFVNLADLAPTFIEAAGLNVPETMTVKSLMNLLLSDKEGQVDPQRNSVLTGREYHDYECREGDVGYPTRALRNKDFLYIRNFEPERWPAGDPIAYRKERGKYGEVDPCPTKAYMLENRDAAEIIKLFELSFAKRPAEEMYDLRQDPGQLNNVAYDPGYAERKNELAASLTDALRTTGDPRVLGKKHAFK